MKQISFLRCNLNSTFVRVDTDQTVEQFCEHMCISQNRVVSEQSFLKAGCVVQILNKVVHVVLPLETLSSIAQKYHVLQSSIEQQNKVSQIFVGQQLVIWLI